MSPAPGRCPACRADLDGGPVPADLRHLFEPPWRWSRALGIAEGGSTVAWECPDCGHRWDRRATLRGIRRVRRDETTH
ncbi:zinc ribbon domain-containing protein [Roseicella aerolata]|uniref:Uncharacterized protein n=1 Tax=Roseicella aerolata TaxID=2883479 RepID=A0A9X1IDM8_9PROT|nr:hypothetical protein [Roseicella aerolata]MCB4821368.1 hypothetical protein [Roseicella aerolata]